MHLKHFLILICLILLSSCAFAQTSGITIEFLKPNTSITYERGQEIEVEARITFPSGSSNENVKAFVAVAMDTEQFDLTKNAQGNYAKKIQVPYEAGSMVQIRVFASANTTGGYSEQSIETTINLEPLSMNVDFNFIPMPPYYLGTIIETISIDLFYSDGRRMPLESLGRQPTLRINQDRQKLDLGEDPESGALVAEINYPIELTEDFLMRGMDRLEVELYDLSDRYGTTMRSVEKEFRIEESHPSLKVRIKTPPENERLFHNIEIPFEIELIKGSDATNEKVYLIDVRDLKNRRECRKVEEEGEKLKFQCMEKIPSMEEMRRMQYVALGTADIAGNKVTIYDIMQTEISNIAYLSLEFPGERENLNDVGNEIRVRFNYSSTGRLEGGLYRGTINGQAVEFVWNPEKGVYVANYDLKSLGEGQHELAFTVEGLELENDTETVHFAPAEIFPDFVQPGGEGFEGPGPLIMLGAIIAIFAIFTFIVWFLVLRKRREEKTDELKEEAAVLKEMLKRIEIDYYKRRLNEEEYKKRALEYQTKLDKTIAKIKAKGIMEKEKKTSGEAGVE